MTETETNTSSCDRTKRVRRADAHVRSRDAIIRRTIDRGCDWRMSGAKGATRGELVARVASALVVFDWRPLLGCNAKGIPVEMIHSLMCAAFSRAAIQTERT